MPKIMSGKQKKKIYKVELAKAQRELINASSRKKKKNIPKEQLLDLVFRITSYNVCYTKLLR